MSAAVALSTPVSPYDWYFAALDGKNPPLRPQQPECGFFRKPGKDKRTRERIWIPVAIFYSGPDLVAIEGERTITDFDEIADLFGWCIKHPVPEEQWRAVVENGEKWPDELPAIETPFSNLPTDPADAILAELQGEKTELEAFLKNGIGSQDASDRAANWKSRIKEIEKRAYALKREGKKPHEDAAKAVEAKFKPADELAKALLKQIEAAQTAYMVAERKRLEEERARQAAENPQEPAKPVNVKSGTIGRTMSLTTVRTAKIVDAEAFVLHLVKLPSPELGDLLQQLGNRIARAGAIAPGIEIVETQVSR